MSSWRQRPNRRVLVCLATMACLALGCPAPPPRPPLAPTTPLGAKSRAGATTLDVRELEGRPKLTLVGRDGDPVAALVIAFAVDRGPVLGAALAGLLQARLVASPAVAPKPRVESDGSGLRVHAQVPDEPDVLLRAIAQAIADPIRPGEPGLERAAEWVGALSRAPLDSEALVPIAECAGHGSVVASAVDWRNDRAGVAVLEAARQQVLVRERTVIAVVGTAAVGERVADALAQVDGWPAGKAVDVASSAPRHAAFRSNALATGAWRLSLGVRVGNAVVAAAMARQLRATSPLQRKLGGLELPWRLTTVDATARPVGGCLVVEAEPARPLPDDRAMASAAEAMATIRDDISVGTQQLHGAFEVTREIIEAPTADDVAARAAWWVLSRSVERAPVASSALATSAADATVRSADDASLSADYRQRVADRKAPTATLDQRVAVEAGQGHLWLLVGNPCALSQEGLWDAGRAALAAAASAQAVTSADVVVEPWVGPAGVGILAHGGLTAADESPLALAERVADAAGRAYTALSWDPAAFDATRRSVLRTIGGDRGAVLAALAERASPAYPGWLAPWGAPSRLASADAIDVAERWAALVRGPRRVAVIANTDEAQGQRAVERLGRWLVKASGERCDAAPVGEPAKTGRHEMIGHEPGSTVAVAVAFPDQELAEATLTREWLAAPNGPLRGVRASTRLEVELLAGAPRATLAVLAQVANDDREQTESAIVAALVALGRQAPDEAAHAEAQRRFRTSQLARRAHPARRVAELWSTRPPMIAPDRTTWSAWLARRLSKPDALVVLAED
jgi:hypothetical protein